MGPIIGVPDEVADTLEQNTDLVEVVVMADAVDELDVQLGSAPGVLLLLVETPKNGFGQLVTTISDYAGRSSGSLTLTVRDKEGTAHPFLDSTASPQSVHDHLKLAHYGEPGDRRPLLRD
jgi:hypothetical protein